MYASYQGLHKPEPVPCNFAAVDSFKSDSIVVVLQMYEV